MANTHLYRHFDSDGALLYVGVSLNAVARLAGHETFSHWFDRIARVEIEHFPNREAALSAEKEAITTESPKCNLKHVPRAPEVSPCIEESRSALARRVVSFMPVYRIEDAAAVLCIGRETVRRLVANGEIGSITDENCGRYGRALITGWQLLEYLEAKMAEAKKAA
jgi:excisionase family DNA binding protein